MFENEILQHACRMVESQEYRNGYAFAIDHDAFYDLMSTSDLLGLVVIFHSFKSAHADGRAYYCWKLACAREGYIELGRVIWLCGTVQIYMEKSHAAL